MNDKDVYLQCEMKFVLLSNGNFNQLIKKPSTAMPVMQFTPLENVYKSGYFTNLPTTGDIPDSSQPNIEPVEPEICSNMPSTSTATPTVDVTDMEPPKVPLPAETSTNNSSYAPVAFPLAAKVCKTSVKSELLDFNPLNDSKPNLEFDMTSQNDEPDLHVKLLQDAKTHKWQVKIRNLTKEQIDFLAGPKLLPALSKADAIVIEHTPDNEIEKAPSLEQIYESVMQKQSKTEDRPNSNVGVLPNKPVSDKTRTRTRPPRVAAKNINYATMTTLDEDSDKDDKYKPEPVTCPKLRNKCYPSATRIATQRSKQQRTEGDHDILKPPRASQPSQNRPYQK